MDFASTYESWRVEITWKQQRSEHFGKATVPPYSKMASKVNTSVSGAFMNYAK
jgi:hypothetical protein